MPYRQKSGTWRASKMIDGKRRQRVFTTRAAAVKWEAVQDARAWEKEKRAVTAFELAEAYLDFSIERFSKKTYLKKRIAFQNLFQFIDKHIQIDDMPAKGILDALRSRALASGNAANKDRKHLGAAWSWGVKYLGRPDQYPFRKVERFAHDERARYVPTEADFWKAHAAAAPEDQAFLLTALHTAAKRGEIFRLMWPDVDLETGSIRLGTRKTATGVDLATILMTSEHRQVLAAHRKRGLASLYVFCQEDGQPFTSRQHYMERLCKRAEVKPFGFHAIRHLSASILARAGVDIPTIQAILRHKSPNTTARYLRSLGIVENVLEGVFCAKAKAPEAGTSRA